MTENAEMMRGLTVLFIGVITATVLGCDTSTGETTDDGAVSTIADVGVSDSNQSTDNARENNIETPDQDGEFSEQVSPDDGSATDTTIAPAQPLIEPRLCEPDTQQPVAPMTLQVAECPANHFYVLDSSCSSQDAAGNCAFVCRERVEDCTACDDNHFCLEHIEPASNVPGVYCEPKAALGEPCHLLTNGGGLYKDGKAACLENAICLQGENGGPRCVMPTEANAECFMTEECAAGLACKLETLPNGDNGDYRCTAVTPEDICYSSEDCQRGDKCDTGTNRCLPRGQDGDPCLIDGYLSSGEEDNPTALTYSGDCGNGLFCVPLGICGECQSDAECEIGLRCCVQETGESACSGAEFFGICQNAPGTCRPGID